MMFYAFKPSQNTILFYLNVLSTIGALAQQQNGTHNIVKIDSWNCKGTFYQSKQHKTQQGYTMYIHQHIRKVIFKVAWKVSMGTVLQNKWHTKMQHPIRFLVCVKIYTTLAILIRPFISKIGPFNWLKITLLSLAKIKVAIVK